MISSTDGGGFGLFVDFSHLGMCLAPAFSLKFLLQCGHYNKLTGVTCEGILIKSYILGFIIIEF